MEDVCSDVLREITIIQDKSQRDSYYPGLFKWGLSQNDKQRTYLVYYFLKWLLLSWRIQRVVLLHENVNGLLQGTEMLCHV